MKKIKRLKFKKNDDIHLVTHSSCLIDDVFKKKYCIMSKEEKEELRKLKEKQEKEEAQKRKLAIEEEKKKREEEKKTKEKEKKKKEMEDKGLTYIENTELETSSRQLLP